MKIKKDDNIIIISGKDKGYRGKVTDVDIKKDRVVVDGANLIKKHIKSSKKGEKGQRIEMPAPIHVSNVQLYCENCKRGVKVSFVKKEDGSKKRICKRCKNEI
jgi:large subunit ribosomal protein L24